MKPERVFATEPGLVLSRRALERRGVRGQDLTEAVRAGHVARVGRGLYAAGILAVGDRIAAVAGGLNGTVSHESAALVLGLPVPGTRGVAVTVPQHRRIRRDTRGVTLHFADLTPADLVMVKGVPVTSVLRTLVDLARTLPLADAVAAADAALHLGLVLPLALEGLRTCVGRGAANVRLMAELADGRSESPHESRLRVLLVLAGLPPDDLQLVVADPDLRWRYRFDMAYLQARLAVEADGIGFHSGPDNVRRDGLRDRRVAELGWLTARIHDADVRTYPEQTLDNLRRILAERG